MPLKKISSTDSALVETFLKSAGKSLERFRYFNSRPISVLSQHRVTLLYFNENNLPVGYGHLDEENGVTWLGNCVAEKETGKGIGKKIMQGLLNFARENKIQNIRLSVDANNKTAQSLYENFGFKVIEKREAVHFYEWEAKKNPEILISTLALAGLPAEKIIEEAEKNKWNIEFSSGMPYRPDMEEFFLQAKIIRYAHNYFPAPEIPFVLNLASSNVNIRRTSIEHCVKGMKLSYACGARFFSAHSGFCIDPSPAELGNPLEKKAFNDKKTHWNLFIDSVKEILHRTKEIDVRFLIENNVIAKMNMYDGGLNPLLCCNADEINELIHTINDKKLGILLDTGHMKVSANTLGFDAATAVRNIANHIDCIHHSDNNGEFDTNHSLPNDYWFNTFLPEFSFATHVLEVKKINAVEINKQIDLIRENMV